MRTGRSPRKKQATDAKPTGGPARKVGGVRRKQKSRSASRSKSKPPAAPAGAQGVRRSSRVRNQKKKGGKK
jgi:hypothetical protein